MEEGDSYNSVELDAEKVGTVWWSSGKEENKIDVYKRQRENSGVWESAGAWREVNTARRSGAISPGGVWAGPGGNAVFCTFWFMDGVTCDDMSGEVHIKLLSRGDTSGEVRRAGLRAGRFVEAGPRAGSSPFLFVCGDDRVIRYTGADVDTGGAEDAQLADSPFLFVCGDDRVIRYTGADVDTGGAEDAQMAE
ncbi:hypothetical protein DEO72_LG11g2442 [Vigna unguiculata]|uniref:Uncharacterized protein n=1 Tax=Vigna unguiculata TaxID=3917 RepID=A0A4D6NR76_VIGUN|nr:hypothetical protein DEO72_LG11g2442 [Vigna unguiculata]